MAPVSGRTWRHWSTLSRCSRRVEKQFSTGTRISAFWLAFLFTGFLCREVILISFSSFVSERFALSATRPVIGVCVPSGEVVVSNSDLQRLIARVRYGPRTASRGFLSGSDVTPLTLFAKVVQRRAFFPFAVIKEDGTRIRPS